ncbi:hypothetical protein [Leucobacter luti]|uniref:Uncharacterized protein n=1 Tax=Leucobacter luti TaxID=340320 RepID=A0A4Q7U097_9MICO|nr:hypothetical protein [Leucobacter luti]MBL3699285.1 hypothetical protein [Leucobacter luti]RZT66794.1 hypothetical protein EV139_0921 [Leucobacter luti]
MNPFRLATRLQPPPGVRVRAAARGGACGERPPTAEPAPVPVPWRVTLRSASGVIEVQQCGDRPLHSVRFALAGSGMLGLSLPRTVGPGERLRVTLRGTHSEAAAVAPDAMLVLRWFQPDGTELLWPIAL